MRNTLQMSTLHTIVILSLHSIAYFKNSVVSAKCLHLDVVFSVELIDPSIVSGHLLLQADYLHLEVIDGTL